MHAELKITAAGELLFLYDDELRAFLALGLADVRRASHVEPCVLGEPLLAGVPPLLGDGVCAWTADMDPVRSALRRRDGSLAAGLDERRVDEAATAVLGPFLSRQAALFAEKGHLEHLLFADACPGGAS